MNQDESTIAVNNALMMANVRYFHENNILREEMLFATNFIAYTRGLSIFNAVIHLQK